MKKVFNRIIGNRWVLIGSAFPYQEEYRLFNSWLGRYVYAGTRYGRAVRLKQQLEVRNDR
jgi:hypothetical protein